MEGNQKYLLLNAILIQQLLWVPLLAVTFGAMLKTTTARPILEVRVSNNGNDSPKCLTNSSYPCRSIFYAMTNIKSSSKINRVILGAGIHSLNSTIRMQQFVHGFELVGEKSLAKMPVINCTANNSGLYFNRSYNLIFQNFALHNCGAIFSSSNQHNGTVLNLTTAFHLTECKNVTLQYVDIRDSFGVGAVFYDVTGNVRFNQVVFSGNAERKETMKYPQGSSSGGGIYIEFRPAIGRGGNEKNRNDKTTASEFNSHSQYTFSHCKFLYNRAEFRHSIISESVRQDFVSFGRGGGISFIGRGGSTGNFLNVDVCTFEGNKALWGAGIFAEFDDQSGNQGINIRGSSFFNNTVTMAGGGIRIGVNVHKGIGLIKVNISHTTFGYNAAKIGGAFSQYRPSNDGREENTVVLNNCTFENNTAYVATNVHLQHLNLLMINTSILNDRRNFAAQSDHIPRQGALYCYSSNITLRGENTIAGNHFTAFVLDACLVFVYDSSTFRNNTGKLGGAIALYSHSVIRMTNGSRLFVHYNKALDKGGAMFVETPVQTHNKINSTELKIYPCFLRFGDYDGAYKHADTFNAKIYFKGNSAPGVQFGNAVWATTLTWCRERDEGNYNNTVLNTWETVDYAGESALTSVATSPTFIDTDESDWNAYPGITFKPSITLRDENWNEISATLRVKVKSMKGGTVSTPYSHVIVVSGKAVMMLEGEQGAKYSVILETEYRYSVSKYISNRHLSNGCPPGFHYSNKRQRCVCLAVSDGVTQCEMQTKSVSILQGRWGNPKGGKDFVKHTCPRHFCKPCNKTSLGCLYEQKKQCSLGRKQDSILCSECENGLSVVVGAEECRKCDSRAKGLYIVLFMLIVTVFVLAVMLVNLDVHSSYLNAFFYSYQIIPLLTADITFDPVCSFIIGITNLTGFGGIQKGLCIGFHLNNMLKIILNYLIPIYIIACMVGIGALSYCFKKIPFNNKACFRAFVFISVFAYSDFTRITFNLLKPVRIEGHTYVYYAAYMSYFGKQHAPYAAFALVVLVFVVIGFPLALIFSHAITANAKFVKLKAIFDTFQKPFSKKPYFDFFPAFYFITRFLLLLIDSTIEHRAVHRALMGIVCILVVYIFTLLNPYESELMNYHDSLLLVNIAIIAVLNIAMGEAYVTSDRDGLRIMVQILVYIPFLCLSIRAAYWLFVKIKHRRAAKTGRTNSGRARSVIVPKRVTENDEVEDDHHRWRHSNQSKNAGKRGTHLTKM